MTNTNTNTQPEIEKALFKIADQLVILTTQTIHELIYQIEDKQLGIDALSLYNFYYYISKWQKTNQPKAVNSYARKGLGWGNRRLDAAKKLLIEKGLIENVERRDSKNKITGWYIKINYKWKTDSIASILKEMSVNESSDVALTPLEEKASDVHMHKVDFNTTNTYNEIRNNAYSKDKKKRKKNSFSKSHEENETIKDRDALVSRGSSVLAINAAKVSDYSNEYRPLTVIEKYNIAKKFGVSPSVVTKFENEVLEAFREGRLKVKRNIVWTTEKFLKSKIELGLVDTIDHFNKVDEWVGAETIRDSIEKFHPLVSAVIKYNHTHYVLNEAKNLIKYYTSLPHWSKVKDSEQPRLVNKYNEAKNALEAAKTEYLQMIELYPEKYEELKNKSN